MNVRPEQTWHFVFTKDNANIEMDQSGITPCQARGKAWNDLEALLKIYQEGDRKGWRLASQKPVINGQIIGS